MMKLLSIVKSNKSWVLADQVVYSCTGFATTILLAKYLTIEQFGQYSSIIIYLFLLLSISGALIISPFQILYAKHQQSKSYLPSLFIMQVAICVIMILATFGIYNLFSKHLPYLVNELPLVILLIAGFLLHDFIRRVLIGIDKTKTAFIVDAIGGAMQVSSLLYVLEFNAPTLHNALLSIVATYIPSTVIGALTLFKTIPSKTRILYYIKIHFKSGSWLLLSSFFQWWSTNFLVALSGLFLGIEALGALRLAQSLFGVLNAILQMIENYVLPTASKMYEQSTKKFKEYLQHTTLLSLVIIAPAILIALLFPKEIYGLMGGDKYANYAFVLQGMAMLYLLIFIGYPIRIAIRVFMLNSHFFVAYVATFIFSFLTAKIIISHWNLYGVILALMLNQLLMLSYWQYVLFKKKFLLWK